MRLLSSHSCQTGCSSLTLKKPHSLFDQVLYSYHIKKPTRLPYDNSYPIVQSATITVPCLYLYWSGLLQWAVWQGALSVLDMPCSPQALVLQSSAKLQGQIACNRSAISLSSSVSSLDPTSGSKEGYHSPIKKVNLPLCTPLTLLLLSMTSLALIFFYPCCLLSSFLFLFHISRPSKWCFFYTNAVWVNAY